MGLWDNEYYGTIAHDVCWGIVSFTSAVIALRFYARIIAKPRKRLGALGLDDAITFISWIVLMVTQIFITIAASHGFGRRYDTLDRNQQISAVKWGIIIDAVIIWAFSLPKLAIIALLKRILDYGMHTSVLFWTLAFVGQAFIFSMSVFIFVQCDPVAKNWDKDVPGTCLPTDVLIGIEYFASSWSAFLDLFFALYPAPFIMRLNMPLRKRIAVTAALGLGVFAGVIQGYKLSILGLSFQYTNADPTFPKAYLNTFGISEACLLLIAGSLPALGPLIRKAKNKFTELSGSLGFSVSEVRELRDPSKPRTPAGHEARGLGPLAFVGHDINAVPPRKESASTGGQTLTEDLESAADIIGSPGKTPTSTTSLPIERTSGL